MNMYKDFENIRKLEYALLVLVVLLSIIIGIVGSMLYYQKSQIKTINPGTIVQNQHQPLQSAAEVYNSLVASVKSRNGNKITLTDLPAFTPVGGDNRQLILFVSDKTVITKIKIDQNPSNLSSIDISKLPEIPATLEDIKEKYSLYVELNESVDLGGETKTVEAKKIRINGGPGFE